MNILCICISVIFIIKFIVYFAAKKYATIEPRFIEAVSKTYNLTPLAAEFSCFISAVIALLAEYIPFLIIANTLNNNVIWLWYSVMFVFSVFIGWYFNLLFKENVNRERVGITNTLTILSIIEEIMSGLFGIVTLFMEITK